MKLLIKENKESDMLLNVNNIYKDGLKLKSYIKLIEKIDSKHGKKLKKVFESFIDEVDVVMEDIEFGKYIKESK
ncbi:MAG: hypothetical protein KAI79_20475 [Bacteroidales bacterium]|nr:hypothetical protein [Bacteroidales bacterium]